MATLPQWIEARVIQKIATEAEWNEITLVPYKGEVCLVGDSGGKVINIKIGDGINTFPNLEYMFDSIQQNVGYIAIESNALPTPLDDVAWGMVTGGTYTFGGSDVFTVPAGHWGIANYSSGAWTLVDMGELPQISVADEYGESTSAAASQRLVTDVKELIVTTQVEEIVTDMISGTATGNTITRHIVDTSITWEQGDLLKSVYIPYHNGTTNSVDTILYIYKNHEIQRSYNLGVLNGETTVDLLPYDVILDTDEYPAIGAVPYLSGAGDQQRWYDEVSETWLNTNRYLFRFTLEREIGEVNRIHELESQVDKSVITNMSVKDSADLTLELEVKNIKTGDLPPLELPIPNATQEKSGALSHVDKKRIDEHQDVLYDSRVVSIDTQPGLPATTTNNVNVARRVRDLTIELQAGDLIKSVYIGRQTSGSSSELPTKLFVYAVDNTIKNEIDLGVFSDNRTIDLTTYNLVAEEGDYLAVQILCYEITPSGQRFYDLINNVYLSNFVYFFSFTIDRTVYDSEIQFLKEKDEELEERIDDLENTEVLPTKGKKILILGDSAVQNSTNWAQRMIEDLQFDPSSLVLAAGGYTYATKYDEGTSGTYSACLRNLIDTLESNYPTFYPDLILLQIGGNDFGLYVSNNERLGTLEDAMLPYYYTQVNDYTIYGGIRYSLERLKRRFPSATMLVGSNFQMGGNTREVVANAIKEVTSGLSIPFYDANAESGISYKNETIAPRYTDSPTSSPTRDYPYYNWIEPDGTLVTVVDKSEDAVKLYGMYTYDGTHPTSAGGDKILAYMKSVVLSKYR